jgi:hypothetical protein
MTTRFSLFYAALFLLAQIFGAVLGFLGYFSPQTYFSWSLSPGSLLLSVVMLLASIAMPIHIWRQSLSPALYALPAYHLLGLIAMEVRSSRMAADLAAEHGIEPMAAQWAALQTPDLLFTVLVHSAIGLVGGIYLMALLAPRNVSGGRAVRR